MEREMMVDGAKWVLRGASTSDFFIRPLLHHPSATLGGADCHHAFWAASGWAHSGSAWEMQTTVVLTHAILASYLGMGLSQLCFRSNDPMLWACEHPDWIALRADCKLVRTIFPQIATSDTTISSNFFPARKSLRVRAISSRATEQESKVHGVDYSL